MIDLTIQTDDFFNRLNLLFAEVCLIQLSNCRRPRLKLLLSCQSKIRAHVCHDDIRDFFDWKSYKIISKSFCWEFELIELKFNLITSFHSHDSVNARNLLAFENVGFLMKLWVRKRRKNFFKWEHFAFHLIRRHKHLTFKEVSLYLLCFLFALEKHEPVFLELLEELCIRVHDLQDFCCFITGKFWFTEVGVHKAAN